MKPNRRLAVLIGVNHLQGYFFGTAAATLAPLEKPFREEIAKLVRGEDA